MPVSTINFPFLVDGRNVPVFCKEAPLKWRDAAEAKGFRLVARAQDRLHVILGCLSCGLPTLKRISVVLGYEPECPHCIGEGRKAAAASVGAKLVGPQAAVERLTKMLRARLATQALVETVTLEWFPDDGSGDKADLDALMKTSASNANGPNLRNCNEPWFALSKLRRISRRRA